MSHKTIMDVAYASGCKLLEPRAPWLLFMGTIILRQIGGLILTIEKRQAPKRKLKSSKLLKA